MNGNYISGVEAQKLKEHNEIIKKIKQNGGVGGVKVEPQGIYFATQNLDEKIYVYIRRHWSENLGWFIRNFTYCFLPLLLYAIFSVFNIEFDFLSGREYLILLICFYSLIITNVFKDFFDWYYDPYIITNQRVIHYEFKPFSKYEVKETELVSIENVTEVSAGLIAGLWGYGTLTVSTEAHDELFVFKRVPNPTQVRDILID
ncbi:hypothetical protein KC669_04725, partial [Candidatus Dojkabacteria bacterium]|nr:hypothetical protein [Candidatus Dojkabacteria bacterium]